MVFLNYSTMEMVAKIVYYGPGLGGKTTNLKTIYQRTSAKDRGEMVSLATETDRTLFFDLLPMDVGVIGGFKTKFQLYTVPGQVFYNTTRKLVLRGVDGIVFVADSQIPMMDANIESFQNLKENLAELNLTTDDVPLVIQYNKRDLPNVMTLEAMQRALNPHGFPNTEASALNGVGVFETLREVSRQTLMELNTRNLGKKKQGRPAAVAPIEEAMPEDVSFEDFEDEATVVAEAQPQAAVAPKEARDSFERTLDKMELNLSDEDDFLEDDSLDMEEFDDWEGEDSLDTSMEESTDETSPGHQITRELPDPVIETEALHPDDMTTYDLDNAEVGQDLPNELAGNDFSSPDEGNTYNFPDDDTERPRDSEDDLSLSDTGASVSEFDEDDALDLEVEAALNPSEDLSSVADDTYDQSPLADFEETHQLQATEDSELNFQTDTSTDALNTDELPSFNSGELADLSLDDDMDLEDSFSMKETDDQDAFDGYDFNELPGEASLASLDEDLQGKIDEFDDDTPSEHTPQDPEPEEFLEIDVPDHVNLEDMDAVAPHDHTAIHINNASSDEDTNGDSLSVLPDSELGPYPYESEPDPVDLDLSSDLEPLDMVPPAAKPTPAEKPSPPVTPAEAKPIPVMTPPAKPKRSVSSDPLEELKRLTTRIQTTKSSKSKEKAIDGLLLGALGSREKAPKTEKHTIKVPSSFQDAQLNCVFLDEGGNVVHAELLKIKPRKMKDGSFQLRIVVDVAIED